MNVSWVKKERKYSAAASPSDYNFESQYNLAKLHPGTIAAHVVHDGKPIILGSGIAKNTGDIPSTSALYQVFIYSPVLGHYSNANWKSGFYNFTAAVDTLAVTKASLTTSSQSLI